MLVLRIGIQQKWWDNEVQIKHHSSRPVAHWSLVASCLLLASLLASYFILGNPLISSHHPVLVEFRWSLLINIFIWTVAILILHLIPSPNITDGNVYIYTLQFFVEELIRKKRGGKRLGRLWPSLSHKRRSSRGTGAVRVHVSRSKKRNDTMKYVLVTGGVVSGLGKGVTASSIGVVLKACGLRVTCIKIGSLSTPFSFLFIFFHKSLLILVQIQIQQQDSFLHLDIRLLMGF